ncbi:MAG TPA: DinB family protein [Thermoanaerobaculia bacterium]|nr:DinB family protein [Thermoanaerobaculia bacterium]
MRERAADDACCIGMSQELRDQLIKALDWDGAHIRFDDTVKDFPADLRGTRPPGAPHSAWELLEHLRITLWDILEFSRDAKHVSPEFPSGYWPSTEAPPDANAWDASVAAYRADLRALADLTNDSNVDLFARIPHGNGQTLLREVLLSIDHNAYHLGQLVGVRRMLA